MTNCTTHKFVFLRINNWLEPLHLLFFLRIHCEKFPKTTVKALSSNPLIFKCTRKPINSTLFLLAHSFYFVLLFGVLPPGIF